MHFGAIKKQKEFYATPGILNFASGELPSYRYMDILHILRQYGLSDAIASFGRCRRFVVMGITFLPRVASVKLLAIILFANSGSLKV